jgi:hypothetical protein
MLIASDVTNIVGLAQEYSLMGVHNKLCKLYILKDMNFDAHDLNNLLLIDFSLRKYSLSSDWYIPDALFSFSFWKWLCGMPTMHQKATNICSNWL